MSSLLNNHPDTFAAVQIHLGDAYATSWGNSRASFYGVSGTPTIEFDGVLEVVGGYSGMSYESQYNTRRAVATDVTVTLSAVQVSGPTYNVTAQVCIEPGGIGKTMRVYIVQVLDHWPSSPSYSRYGFKQAAATEDVTLASGDCATVVRQFTFDSTSWSNPDDIVLIAWAQVPASGGPAEVYNAAKLQYPFLSDCNQNGIPDECDLDCDAPGCSGYPGCGQSTDCNNNGIPDECEAGGTDDCNNNGVPDLCDLFSGTSQDCNENGIPDECDIADGTSQDCQPNGIPDECDIGHPQAADNCADAQIVCPGNTYYGSTVGATNDGDASCGTSNDSPDVWYYFQPWGSGYITLSLCGSSFDTVLSIYDGCPSAGGTELNCSDDYAPCAPASAFSQLVLSGHEYWIRISGNDGQTGDFELSVAGPACAFQAGDENDNGIPDDCENPCAGQLLGDANCNGVVNAFDIDAFILALTDESAWLAQYGDLGCDLLCIADCNGDGSVNAFDIDPFIALLTGK